MTIDKDEFTVWREHPVTQAYFEKIAEEVDRTRKSWEEQAWVKGDLSDRTHASHRERVDTLEYMRNLEFEDIFEQEDK